MKSKHELKNITLLILRKHMIMLPSKIEHTTSLESIQLEIKYSKERFKEMNVLTKECIVS